MDEERGQMRHGTTVDGVEFQTWALTRHDPAGGSVQARDLLFLHGMAAGNWIWTPYWLDLFTAEGYRCWTMSLPGRAGGGTAGFDPRALDRVLASAIGGDNPGAALDAIARALPGAALFRGPGLDDHSDALAAAVASIRRPTVVISHSLGGAVAQNALRRGKIDADNVLLCSVPPYGAWRASLEMAMTNLPLWKALFDFSVFGMAAADIDVVRAGLFPDGIGEHDFLNLLTRLTDESLPATVRTAGFPPFAPLPGPKGNMLVIGAEKDRFVPPLDVHLTALYYGSSAHIVQGAGHMAMYEPRSAAATAAIILNWLAATAPVS